MATKTVTNKLTEKELQYNRKVKSVELAIKASVGRNGATISTVIKNAKEIYNYLIEQ